MNPFFYPIFDQCCRQHGRFLASLFQCFSFLLVSIKTIKTFIWLLALETRQVLLSLTLSPFFQSKLDFKLENQLLLKLLFHKLGYFLQSSSALVLKFFSIFSFCFQPQSGTSTAPRKPPRRNMSVSPYRGGQGGHYNTMASVSSNKSRRGQGHSQGTKKGQFLLMKGQILAKISYIPHWIKN